MDQMVFFTMKFLSFENNLKFDWIILYSHMLLMSVMTWKFQVKRKINRLEKIKAKTDVDDVL